MPTDLRPKKQGDHVFAKDLQKIFDDLTARVGTVIGDGNEARALVAAFARCKAILAEPIYHTTVDKGPSSPDGDPHSRSYSHFKQAFARAILQYLFAIKRLYQPLPGPGASREVMARFHRDVEHNDQFVVQAVLGIDLALSEWVRSVVDESAAELASDEGVDLTAGHAGLRRIRVEVLAAVRRR